MKYLDFESFNLQISSTDSCDFMKLFKEDEKYFTGIPANVIRILNDSELYENLEKQTETSLEKALATLKELHQYLSSDKFDKISQIDLKAET